MLNLVAIDTETVRDEPWSVQWSTKPGEGRMILANDQTQLRRLGSLLASSSTLTIVHNALFDLKVLDALGIRPHAFADTMVMAYLLGESSIGLKTLSYRHCNMNLCAYKEVVADAAREKALEYLVTVKEREWRDPDPVLEIRPDGEEHVRFPQNINTKINRLLKRVEGGDGGIDLREKWNIMDGREAIEKELGALEPGYLSDILFEDAVQYACGDADATFRLYPVLWARIQSEGLEEVFWRDMGMIPMVVDMMKAGILINKEHFYLLEEEFDEKAGRILGEIEQMHGGYLNPGSAKQVLVALLARGLDIKSTDAKELDAHRGDELVRLIQDYRGYKKLVSTYVGVLPTLADSNGRVHTKFSITRTATGRLASSNPNLQNQPVRSEDGRRIREGFIAERSE